MFIDRKTHYCKDVSSQINLYIQNNLNQNLSKLFYECQQIYYKVYIGTANTIMKDKNKVRGLALPKF